jgi:uncharacterized membrane protein
MKVSKSRSFVKALSYRIFGTLSSWAVVFVITGEGTLAVLIAFWETVIKIFIYYAHERAWNLVSWGRRGK